MPNPTGRTAIDPAELAEFKRLCAEHLNGNGGPNIAHIARLMNKDRGTLQRWKSAIAAEAPEKIEYPDFVIDGDEEEPIEDILTRLHKSHLRKKKEIEARQWFEIKVKEDKPYGFLVFGDPHLGVNTEWDLLNRHIEVAKQDGVYTGSIGDVTDGWPWTGRMAKLWSEVDISNKTERRLAKWFMFEAGIKWLVFLLGNHDQWNGQEFYKQLGAHYVPVIDWRAQFTLVHNNGSRVRIDASHGRKGTSIYNPTHGTLRDAKFGEQADVFVTGHIHSFGLFEIEFPEKKHKAWLAQVSGYKIGGLYETTNGFAQSRHGAGVLIVIDPETASVQCFSDVERGADYLKYLRAK